MTKDIQKTQVQIAADAKIRQDAANKAEQDQKVWEKKERDRGGERERRQRERGREEREREREGGRERDEEVFLSSV